MARPAWWDDACAGLAAADPVMARLIASWPDAELVSRGEPFETLLRAIVGQQISVRAADAVWKRLSAVLSGQPSPERVLALPEEVLRSAGLSARKVLYARDLAECFTDGRVNPAAHAGLDDEALIAELVAVRGIGRWTAEMYLIFNQLRPDVWPVDDIGLQRAMARHYALEDQKTSLAQLRVMGERFAPWRTVATWYLWRSLDPQTVLY